MQVVILYTQLLPRAACALCHIFMSTLKGLAQTVLAAGWLPGEPMSAVCRATRWPFGPRRAEDRARQRGQRPKRGQRPVGGQRAEDGDS